MRRLLLALVAVVTAWAATPATAANTDPRLTSPTGLIITYHVDPGDRPALRQAMLGEGIARLDRLRAEKRVAHYRLLWGRYADTVGWDMMLILDLDTPGRIGGWRSVEEAAPGALPPAAARLVKRIDTTPMDIMRSKRADETIKPVYLVVPYDYLIGVNDYIKYVDGYVVPQMDGWLAAKALGGYEFLLSRYPAGRQWTAMLLLAYRGDEGLGRRDAVVREVRERLASNASWKAFADNKQNIREERAPIVADVLAQR